jgi:hypothetical protein
MDRLLKTKGYKIIRNVIPHNLLNDMILLIAKRFTEITKQELKSKPIINFNVSKELEDNLLNLRENKPEIFSYLYDSVQSSVSLNQLITYKKLINNLCKTTGIKKEFFSTSGHIQRIDNPYDKKNLYSWHQETSYYGQSPSGDNCFFVWIPLFNAEKKNGSVIIAEGSHMEGYIKTDLKKKNDKFSSQQRIIDEKVVKKYKLSQPKINKGDVCIMHFNTLHKSGLNSTNKFRFTAIGRFHFTSTPGFKPFRYKIQLNNIKPNKGL